MFTFTFMHLADAFIQSDLQLYSGYTFFVSTCVRWESNPQPLCCWRNALNTEPQEHRCAFVICAFVHRCAFVILLINALTLRMKSGGVPGRTVGLSTPSWCEWINVSSRSNTKILRFTVSEHKHKLTSYSMKISMKTLHVQSRGVRYWKKIISWYFCGFFR